MRCPHCEKEIGDGYPRVHLCAPATAAADVYAEETRLGELLDIDELVADVRRVVHHGLHSKLMDCMLEHTPRGATVYLENERFAHMVDELAREVSQSLVLTVLRAPGSIQGIGDRVEMMRLDRELWKARAERRGLELQVAELKTLLALREK